MERVACEEKVQHVVERVIRDEKARVPKGAYRPGLREESLDGLTRDTAGQCQPPRPEGRSLKGGSTSSG